MATEATRHVVFQTVLLTLSPVAPAAAGQAHAIKLIEGDHAVTSTKIELELCTVL
jgi:hypothetical protein